MSHTNSTTNYNLPQFIGTDKPAWLGDINPAMSAIDTAIKNASDSASTADGKATTAQSDVTTLGNTVTTLQGTVSTQGTQITSNTSAISTLTSGLNSATTDLNAFIQKFNLNSYSKPAAGNAFANLTLAQNSDGSIFKFYGMQQIVTSGSAVSLSETSIPGLPGIYGVATGLTLATAPESAYTVSCAGLYVCTDTNGTTLRSGPRWMDFSVGTDGKIYMISRSDSSSWNIPANSVARFNMYPCLYFNLSFGDSPND